MKLIDITPDNHNTARKIKVKPEQDSFVANIEKTIVDAYVFKTSVFKLIEDDGEIIGYTLLYPFDKDDLRYVNIVRFAIDASYQGKGLGKKALNHILDWIRNNFELDKFKITVEPENSLAKELYIKVGFIEGEVEGKELALYMEV